MNDLTERLLAEGYTKDNHPDHVRWYGNMEEFEYTPEYLETTAWESPCGIMRKGEFTHGYLSYAGVDWRVENDNYNFHCPYNKKECEHFHPLLKGITIGAKCSWHMTDKPYDYDCSAEMIKDESARIVRLNLEQEFGHPSMIHCACCGINEALQPEFKFNPDRCINFTQNGCDNKLCWRTGKVRDLTLANIYYDVKVTTEYKKGFIVEPVVKITKGVKVFSNQRRITDLELYLKMNPDAPMFNEKNKSEHGRGLFMSEYYGEKYDLEILNVRIERRVSRDLKQDLADIQEGIEVLHASDIAKAAKAAKKERREKYKEDKKARKERKTIEKLRTLIEDDEAAKVHAENTGVSVDFVKEQAEKQHKRRGIDIENEPEQVKLF